MPDCSFRKNFFQISNLNLLWRNLRPYSRIRYTRFSRKSQHQFRNHSLIPSVGYFLGIRKTEHRFPGKPPSAAPTRAGPTSASPSAFFPHQIGLVSMTMTSRLSSSSERAARRRRHPGLAANPRQHPPSRGARPGARRSRARPSPPELRLGRR